MRHTCAYEDCDTLLPGDEEHCVIHYRVARDEQQAEEHRERVRALIESGQRRVIPLGHVVPDPDAKAQVRNRVRRFNDELAGLHEPTGAPLPRKVVVQP